jgi:signal transduction histidine kinase
MDHVHERLRHLFEISKILTRFDDVERTVPEVLSLMSEVVPARVAVLLLEDRGRGPPAPTRTFVWRADGTNAVRVTAATAHARSAYAYLTGASARFAEEPESHRFPTPIPPPPESSPVSVSGGFVLLPLVVGRQRIFGGLHLEGSARLDERDLAFVNAIVNQLAIAIDRITAIEAKQALARAGQVTAEVLAQTSASLSSSLDYDETTVAVARAAVPGIADICFLDELVDNGHTARGAEIFVADPGQQGTAKRIGQALAALRSRVSPPGPLAPAPFLLETLEGLTNEPDRAGALQDLGVRSIMGVPLVARGQTLGHLTFVSAGSGRLYSAADLAVAEEIGRRAAIALDNARLYAQARRAIRSRDDILAIVSHDLRNPVGSILISVRLLLKDKVAEEPHVRKRLEVIDRSTQRMKRLLADLIDVGSIEGERLSVWRYPYPGGPIVRDAVELHAAAASEKGIRIESSFPSGPFLVDCDRDRVLQVLGNLIGNAIKFTPRGGTIDVRVESRGSESLFSVADSGPGIAPGDLAHVFDRYWQAKETASLGVGLGLAIAQGLVLAHGGRIWVTSTLGVGATFSFTIPTRGVEPPST